LFIRMPVLWINTAIRSKSPLCPENTPGPTVPCVVRHAPVMIDYLKDVMSLFHSGGLRCFWYMPNVEFNVTTAGWWQKRCPGPEENIICVMRICCILLIGRENYPGKKSHSASGRAGRKCFTRLSMW